VELLGGWNFAAHPARYGYTSTSTCTGPARELDGLLELAVVADRRVRMGWRYARSLRRRSDGRRCAGRKPVPGNASALAARELHGNGRHLGGGGATGLRRWKSARQHARRGDGRTLRHCPRSIRTRQGDRGGDCRRARRASRPGVHVEPPHPFAWSGQRATAARRLAELKIGAHFAGPSHTPGPNDSRPPAGSLSWYCCCCICISVWLNVSVTSRHGRAVRSCDPQRERVRRGPPCSA